MALLFNRLAHNFVKNGYYPTDGVTISRIQNLLAPSGKPMRLLDPCCGEGTALADLRQGLTERSGAQAPAIEALGIEFERGYQIVDTQRLKPPAMTAATGLAIVRATEAVTSGSPC